MRGRLATGYALTAIGAGLIIGLVGLWAAGDIDGLEPPLPPAWGQEANATAPAPRPADPDEEDEDPGPTYEEMQHERWKDKTWRDFPEEFNTKPGPEDYINPQHRAFDNITRTSGPEVKAPKVYGDGAIHFGIALDGTCRALVAGNVATCPSYFTLSKTFPDTTVAHSGTLEWRDGWFGRGQPGLPNHFVDTRYEQGRLHIWIDPPADMWHRIHMIVITASEVSTSYPVRIEDGRLIREALVGRVVDEHCTRAVVGAHDWPYRVADTMRHLGLDCAEGSSTWRSTAVYEDRPVTVIEGPGRQEVYDFWLRDTKKCLADPRLECPAQPFG